MDKEQTAIERLKVASEMSLRAYDKPLRICVSGGKDSSVIQELALRAGIPAEYLHSHTTADAPETVYFVRSEFRRLPVCGQARAGAGVFAVAQIQGRLPPCLWADAGGAETAGAANDQNVGRRPHGDGCI